MGEKGNFLWLVQKHTRNTSCILLMVFAKLLSAMQLSPHGATSTGGTKEKYPLNTPLGYAVRLLSSRTVSLLPLCYLCRSTTRYQIRRTLQLLPKEYDCQRCVMPVNQEPSLLQVVKGRHIFRKSLLSKLIDGRLSCFSILIKLI